jgi:hypothetical protein
MSGLLLRIAKQLIYWAYLSNEKYIQGHYVGELMKLVEAVIITTADDGGYDYDIYTPDDDYEIFN